jgi:hypothetical protein
MFSLKNTLKDAISSAWLVMRLIIPLYVLADILLYLNVLQNISFIFEPITNLINLPKGAALGIAAGMLFNLYAGIAFLAPLGLDGYQWSIVATFLGVAHSMPIENSVMKKLGIPHTYSLVLRVSMAFLAVFIIQLLPESLFTHTIYNDIMPDKERYSSFLNMLKNSLYLAMILTIKVIFLVSSIIFFMAYLKSTKWMQRYQQKTNSLFSIMAGLILGITYGAGILLHEAKTGTLSHKEIFYIATFLMICHSIIEDVLLFVIFGANGWIVATIRLIMALIFSYLAVKIYIKVIR